MSPSPPPVIRARGLTILIIGRAAGPAMILSAWAILALPAAVLAAAAFSAIALCITSFVKKIEDFDIVMGLVIMPMFLFSGTFFPVSAYPDPLQWIIQVVPLYHSVALLRQLTTGAVGPAILIHVAYLAASGVAAFVTAMLRLEKTLIQ